MIHVFLVETYTVTEPIISDSPGICFLNSALLTNENSQ